jgi:hypothetical protein
MHQCKHWTLHAHPHCLLLLLIQTLIQKSIPPHLLTISHLLTIIQLLCLNHLLTFSHLLTISQLIGALFCLGGFELVVLVCDLVGVVTIIVWIGLIWVIDSKEGTYIVPEVMVGSARVVLETLEAELVALVGNIIGHLDKTIGAIDETIIKYVNLVSEFLIHT